MQNKSRIVFRADGSSSIGLGHVVRSLALAEMLLGHFELAFAIQEPEEKLLQQIQRVCNHVISLPATEINHSEAIFLADTVLKPDDVVVLDGYGFDTRYQSEIKNKGCSLVCIDDVHAFPFVADAIINQAGNVDGNKYDMETYSKLYLGPAYALLRLPFLQAAQQVPEYKGSEPRVLLNMGGADPENHTLKILRELHTASVKHVEIVIGSAYGHVTELLEWLQDSSNYQLHKNLSATEMCKLMQSCPVAITSASGVSYEYCAVGGLLFVLKTADNQEGLYNFLIQNKLAENYTLFPERITGITSDTVAERVKKQRQFFDGKSMVRYAHLFQSLSLSARLRLRKAVTTDLLLLYEWANDPAVRARSFNTAPIKLEDHTRWFETKVALPNSYLYIAEVNGEPAAHIRFDVMNERARLSYLISTNYRGKGLGHTVLLKGIKQLLVDNGDINLVEGLVQKDNIASVRAFEKAGFNYGMPHAQHPNAFRFVLQVKK